MLQTDTQCFPCYRQTHSVSHVTDRHKVFPMLQTDTKCFPCYRLFEEAANNLNMTSLLGFLGSLCESSKDQLQQWSRRMTETEAQCGSDRPRMPVNSLHLYRLQAVMLRLANSGRPLIHVIKAWGIVSAYLVEVGAHKGYVMVMT